MKTITKQRMAYVASVALCAAGVVGAISAVGELNDYSVPRMIIQLGVSGAAVMFFGNFAAEIDRRWKIEAARQTPQLTYNTVVNIIHQQCRDRVDKLEGRLRKFVL